MDVERAATEAAKAAKVLAKVIAKASKEEKKQQWKAEKKAASAVARIAYKKEWARRHTENQRTEKAAREVAGHLLQICQPSPSQKGAEELLQMLQPSIKE